MKRRNPDRFWLELTESVRAELVPEFLEILESILSDYDLTTLLNYCGFWHPRSQPRRKPNIEPKWPYCRASLDIGCLAKLVTELGVQPELLRLLCDRGPDYGFTLLVLLEICFQVAFCFRKSFGNNTTDEAFAQQRRQELTQVVLNSPRLLELLSLHLDCPPLWPHFRGKYGLVLMGYLYYRKLPQPSVPRFYQLQYFVCPDTRKFALPSQRQKADPAMEKYLWELARSLSLGQPSETVMKAITRGERPTSVNTKMDAMALVFERLNHIARVLFDCSLCLYGSAATGFATTSSDVDVVLHLGQDKVEELVQEATAWRDRPLEGVDLNYFPARKSSPYVGNWNWLNEKEPAVCATIWAGRKLAWACHRLLGWDVRCVQTAYVPIVRILACIRSTGEAWEVPHVLRPMAHPLPQLFENAYPIIMMTSASISDDEVVHHLKNVANRRYEPMSQWRHYLATLVAMDVVAERMYSSWEPQYNPRVTKAEEAMSAAYLMGEGGEDTEKFFLKLLGEYWRHYRLQKSLAPDDAGPSCCRLSPALIHAKPSCIIDDGRLSPNSNGEDTNEEIWLVEADFNMSRQVGVYNSRLLRAYAYCDPRVVALGLLLKHWAKQKELDDAFMGYLSGYQWTLIIIHFLQHFACLDVPALVKKTHAWQNYTKAFENAQLPPCQYLPLLPNLQEEPPEACKISKKPVTIYEIEGPVDVFFWQPQLGVNRLVDEKSLSVHGEVTGECYWPEDKTLKENPLLYAYTLLRAPFEIDPKEAKVATAITGADKVRLEQNYNLWLARVATAPRPQGNLPDDIQAHIWDKKRHAILERLISNQNEGEQQPFPSLSPLRDSQFIQDHLIDRASLLVKFEDKQVTLTEILFAFFEYYGLRFNFATDMTDIDRVPLLPASKKEFFETSFFKPAMVPRGGKVEGDESKEVDSSIDADAASADVAAVANAPQKVIGRGNGPFQYRGRHFICLRDPFEKLRTIGTSYRCQTRISREILLGLERFGQIFINQADLERKMPLVHDIFSDRPAYNHLAHPIHESLSLYLKGSAALQGSKTGEMYAALLHMIEKNGNYKRLLDPSAPPANPVPLPAEPPPLSQPPPLAEEEEKKISMAQVFKSEQLWQDFQDRCAQPVSLHPDIWKYADFSDPVAWLKFKTGIQLGGNINHQQQNHVESTDLNKAQGLLSSLAAHTGDANFRGKILLEWIQSGGGAGRGDGV